MKYLFIDTNLFTACAWAELEEHNPDLFGYLEDQMKSDKLNLLIPEVIEKEILEKIKGHEFSDKIKIFKDKFEVATKPKEGQKTSDKFRNVKERKAEGIIREKSEKIIKELDELLKKEKQEALSTFNKIKETKGYIFLETTDDILIRGMKRAALKKRPWTEKGAYLNHIDCIAFEAILEKVKTNIKKGKDKIIICSNDKDYFKETDNCILHDDITESLAQYIEEERVVGYQSLVTLIEKEFKNNLTKEQKDVVQNFEEVLPRYTQNSILWDGVVDSKGFLSTYAPTVSQWGINSSRIINNFCRFCGCDFSNFSRLEGLNPFSVSPGINYIFSDIKFCPKCGKEISDI